MVQFAHHARHVGLVGEIGRVHADQARPRPPALACCWFVLGGGLGGDLGAAAELAGCRGVGHDAPDGIHVARRGEQHPFPARDPARPRRGQDAVRGGFARGRQVPREKSAGEAREAGLLVRHGRAAFVQHARAVFHQAGQILLQRARSGPIRVRDPDPRSRRGRQRRRGREPRQEFRDRFRELPSAGIAFVRVVERFGSRAGRG